MFSMTPARFAVLSVLAMVATSVAADNDAIQFDLPPTIAAQPTGEADVSTIECRFRISSLISSPETPKIDQWIVICQPRDHDLAIVDYFPKTDVSTDTDGPVQVKTSNENSQAFGLSLDSHYGQIVKGNLGADKGSKHSESRQYALPAQVRAMTTSGTINRGRGVYFKWKRSANQILEGDKEFRLTLRVPEQWRGSLVNVSIVAQSERRTFGGLDKQIKTLGQAEFTVAVYRQGDDAAAQISKRLADAEYSLRQHADRHVNQPTSISTILKRVAVKLDLEPAEQNNQWIRRLLAGNADPHLDKVIQRQPMNVRLAALDYCDVRDDFARLNGPQKQRANHLASRQSREQEKIE